MFFWLQIEKFKYIEMSTRILLKRFLFFKNWQIQRIIIKNINYII